MRRILALGCGLLLWGCAGHRVTPAPVVAPAPPPAPPPPPVVQPTPPPPAAAPKRDSIVQKAVAAKTAKDSAADAAALDSIAKVTLAANLPEVPIDIEPTWDLNVTEFATQPRVQYYVDYFANRVHDRFQIWLERMPRFEAFVRESMAAEGLPGDLVYLALIESGFSPVAVSRASAVGMWQFMAATGKYYGLQVDGWIDERRDPIKATVAAARHLDDLSERFGSYYLAAAAYNAGAGRVGRGLTQIGSAESNDSLDLSSDDAFFSLADTRLLRPETKDYVPKLIAAALIAKAPKKYGFSEAPPMKPFPRDSIMVEGGTGLDLMARLADTTFEAMRDLNPNLLRAVTPPDRWYVVRLPAGVTDSVVARYASLPPAERRAVVTHKVKSGETVTTLAKKYTTTADLIRTANRNARGSKLTAGSTLYIPVTKAIPATMLREPTPVATTRTVTRTHVVKKGETVSGIARKYGVSAATVRTENRLGATATLRIGQKLVIHQKQRVRAKR